MKINLSKHLWQRFPELTKIIKKDCDERKKLAGGHDFFHALMAAQYGAIIAPDGRTGLLAWIAGLCHNTDRLFPKDRVEGRVREYLELADGLGHEERELIVEAVLEHGKLNSPNDNPVTVALKDADRLAIIGPYCFIRFAQYPHKVPVLNPDFILKPAPGVTYGKPKAVLDFIHWLLEWEPMIRLPKAKELGKPRFEMLRNYLKEVQQQMEEIGLIPYPF